MASGKFITPNSSGSIQLGTTNTTLYTVPTGYYSVFNVSFTNTSSNSVTIKLGLSSSTSPGTAEWIEQQTTIVGYGVFERTGLVLQAGYNVVATASTGSTVNATVYGIETATS
jgi:hypothetical protein